MKVTVNNLEKEKAIDWNKVQLVANSVYIVLISKDQSKSVDKDCFCGTDMHDGEYLDSWDKYEFKPLHGSITLQND